MNCFLKVFPQDGPLLAESLHSCKKDLFWKYWRYLLGPGVCPLPFSSLECRAGASRRQAQLQQLCQPQSALVLPTWSAGRCQASCPLPLSPPPSLPAGAGIPSVPAGKSPMVEQAVQTGSADNLSAKKLAPGKGPSGTQLGSRQVQPSSKTVNGTQAPSPEQELLGSLLLS